MKRLNKTKFNLVYILYCISAMIVLACCNSASRLYSSKDDGKVSHGVLNDSIYTSVKQFLQSYSNTTLHDTILIKYDFNHESCWDMLDTRDKENIKRVIDSYNSTIQKVIDERSAVSVFQFRQPGNNINNYKKWNAKIIIDSSGLLGNILFYDKVMCGSSAIILPDKRFLITRSDSHFESLRYSKEMIEAILKIRND